MVIKKYDSYNLYELDLKKRFQSISCARYVSSSSMKKLYIFYLKKCYNDNNQKSKTS